MSYISYLESLDKRGDREVKKNKKERLCFQLCCRSLLLIGKSRTHKPELFSANNEYA